MGGDRRRGMGGGTGGGIEREGVLYFCGPPPALKNGPNLGICPSVQDWVGAHRRSRQPWFGFVSF